MAAPSEIDMALSELETAIERLHALYNQYFLGIEKMEPTVQRKNVDRKIYALRRLNLRNTAQRFRLQTQIQKYNTHSNHWKRICRQIEEGTYKKHVDIAKRRQAERIRREEEAKKQARLDPNMVLEDAFGEQSEPSPVFEINMDDFGFDEPFAEDSALTEVPNASSGIMDIDDPFADSTVREDPIVHKKPALPRPSAGPGGPAWAEAPKKPATLPKPKPTTPKPPAPTNSPRKQQKVAKPAAKRPEDVGLDKKCAAKIYQTYLAALKKCNQPTQNITLEKVEKSLRKKAEAGNSNVDFKVVIKGGKASIKAVKKN